MILVMIVVTVVIIFVVVEFGWIIVTKIFNYFVTKYIVTYVFVF